jgi:hypothetical protein
MATATAERRLLIAAALLAAAALTAAACGAAPAGGRPRPQPAAAAGPASPEALGAVRDAAAGALATTAAVSIELSGATVFGGRSHADATGSFDFRSLRGALTLVPVGGRAREPVVFTPTAVYVRPPSGAALPRGKSWMVADFSDPEALDASFPALVAQVESLDPALTLSELEWGAASAAPAGAGTVHGRSADRYDVTVDLNRAVAAVSGPAEVPFGRAIASEIVALGGSVTAGAAPPATLAARVWVAGGQLARVDLSPPGAGLGTASLTLSGFGAPVRADPPPQAQVVDVLALAPSGERENRNGGDSDGG